MINYNPSFINFSISEMRTHEKDIRRWAKSENSLVAELAKEVIQAAEGGELLQAAEQDQKNQ